ncbi:hypothetical protein [Acidithiobacillus sp.]|uniref:hypothetical protein n=1 Tax=Acidithiobacillus sp. TaxID=1872118 RepID=UPI003D023D8F
MFAHTLLVYLPFLVFMAGMGASEMRGIHAGVALSYWMAPKRPGCYPGDVAECLALEWIGEVYGASVASRLLRRWLLFMGLLGCFSAMAVLLVEGWFGVRGGTPPAGLWFSLWYLSSIALLFVPMLVVQIRWRTPLRQREERATAQVFGSDRVLLLVAERLRARYPDATHGISLWAFPMSRVGFLHRFAGAPFWFFLSALVALFFSATSVLAFLAGVSFLTALLMLPVNLFGFLSAFGTWALPTDKEQCAFPIAVFLDSVRAL